MSAPSTQTTVQHFGKTVKTNSTDLRALVLDYLVNNCYTETARSLVKESEVKHLDADGDVIIPPSAPDRTSSLDLTEKDWSTIELRGEIRDLILSGRVEEATALLGEHFPAVFNPRLQPRSNKRPKASDTVKYVPHSSVEPYHVSLNLRVLAFVEACRTVPLPYTRNLASSSSASPTEGKTSLPGTPSSHDTTASPVLRSDTELADLVLRAQKLHASVQMLPTSRARETFSEQLKYISGLLAYPIPERSPLRKFLGQSHRNAVADQVNNAILHWSGSPSVSRLELCTRYTTVIAAMMRDLHMNTPSSSGQQFPTNFSLSNFVKES